VIFTGRRTTDSPPHRHPIEEFFKRAPQRFPWMIPDRLPIYFDDFFAFPDVQSFPMAVSSFQNLNLRLPTKFAISKERCRAAETR
jgi:hypothetical protein